MCEADENDPCNFNFEDLEWMSCEELAQLDHCNRCKVLNTFPAVELALDELAGQVFQQSVRRLNKRKARNTKDELNKWKDKNRNGLLSKDSVVRALAVRYAPQKGQSTCCPPSELPVRTFQLGHPKVPWSGEDKLVAFNAWLKLPSSSSHLSRCCEFAWVRACEQGVYPESDHDRVLAFYYLYDFFDTKINRYLGKWLKNNSHKPTEDVSDAVQEGWRNFYNSYLAANEGRADRDRWSAIGNLTRLIALTFAYRRLPRLLFRFCRQALDDMKQFGLPNELVEQLFSLIDKSWRTKNDFLGAVQQIIGEEALNQHHEALLAHVERVPKQGRFEADSESRIANLSSRAMEPTEHSRRRLTNAIIENENPDGGDMIAIAPDVLQSILGGPNHWDCCKLKQKWNLPNLSDLQRGRLVDYCIRFTRAHELARIEVVSKTAISIALSRAFRNIRCCLITTLGDPFIRDARTALKTYLRATEIFIEDPDKYQELRRALANANDARPGTGLSRKEFPLPGAGLLGIVFDEEQVKSLCSIGENDVGIAFDYHFLAKPEADLLIKHKIDNAESLYQQLNANWVAIRQRVQTAVHSGEQQEPDNAPIV